MKHKILVVSSYPEKGLIHGDKTVGIASYTKNLLMHLPNFDFEVMAEILGTREIYREKGVLVNRIWKRHSIGSLIALADYVANSKIKTLIVPLEFYMFGGILENIVFFSVLFYWKMCGKKIILVLHQVVTALKILYVPLIFLSEKIVVLEERFRRILNNKKIVFIPHAVEKATRRVSSQEKKFSALYFGFLSPYKGISELVSLWKKNYGELVIVGGGNPNHMRNKTYADFVKQIKTTGFVPEHKIADYFSKTDLVILPYKLFFSSSGPLSLAFSYEKPFILSNPLTGYFDSPDFNETLKETGLKKEDFLFDFNKKNFEKRLEWAKKNLAKLSRFSRIMKEKRSWDKINKVYEKLLK